MNEQNLPDDDNDSTSEISQDTHGYMSGGQQACIGDNNSLTQDNRISVNIIYNPASPYLKLEKSDFQKPLTLWGRIKNYFGVLLFLISTLISWVLCGLGAGFPFPYQQCINLLFSCFNGKIAEEVNNFQKNLQYEHISSKSVQELNQIFVQADLYLGILKRLASNGGECDDRLAKTIEALKNKKSRIKDKLDPQQTREYQKVLQKIDKFSNLLNSLRNEDEVQKIERVLENVTCRIKLNETPQSLYQDTLTWLLEESLNTQKITPYQLGVIYRIQNLIIEIEKKESKKLPFTILRYLDGNYIGNVSNSDNRYHSQKRCQYWKALAFDYMLKEDSDRRIISSTDELPFVSRGMQLCEICHPDQRKFP